MSKTLGYCDGSYDGCDPDGWDGNSYSGIDHTIPEGHAQTTDCDEWLSIEDIKSHKASCTDAACECKRGSE